MLATLFISLALAGATPGVDPEALVARLGSPRYQEREEAASELERLGRVALPALLLARDARDPEIRLRVSGLIGKIEGRLLTQATLLTLDFENAPITDVVKSLSQQAGIKLSLVPETSPQWQTRRVTLRQSSPVPFWQAVDLLCDAGRLQYNAAMNAFPQGKERAFPLYDGAMVPTNPYHDSGPFRVNVTGLHYQRNVSFPPAQRATGLTPLPALGPERVAGEPPVAAKGQGGPQVTEQFHVQLQVVCEPRLSIGQNGNVRVEEAIDDRGQALANPVGRGAVARSAAYFGMGAGSALQLQATLNRPENPGKLIKRFRGAIPVTVSTRKPDPLAVNLKEENERTARNGDVEVVVHEVKAQENTRQTLIELTVRRLSDDAQDGPGELTAGRNPNASQQQIEIVDAQGRVLTWYQTGFNAESERLTLTLIPQGGEPNNGPVELRYYGLVRASAEVEFDFHDLLMP